MYCGTMLNAVPVPRDSVDGSDEPVFSPPADLQDTVSVVASNLIAHDDTFEPPTPSPFHVLIAWTCAGCV